MSESQAADYKKIRPAIDADSLEFWAACRRHNMSIQKCDGCGALRYPPRHHCQKCLSDKSTWAPISGKGIVYSTVTFYHPFHSAWTGDVPYNVSLVELAEGPRVWTNVIGIAHDEVKIGMPVEIAYDDVTSDLTLPRFRPISQAPA